MKTSTFFFTVFELQDTLVLESQVFDCSVKIKKLMSPACIPSEAFTLPSENKGFRLPKLDVPTFNGDIQTRDKYNYFLSDLSTCQTILIVGRTWSYWIFRTDTYLHKVAEFLYIHVRCGLRDLRGEGYPTYTAKIKQDN